MSAQRFGLFGLLLLLLLGLGWVSLDRLGGAGEQARTGPERLPQVPKDLTIRAVAWFTPRDQEPVRIAAHPESGRLYVLGGGGDVSLLDLEGGKKQLVLKG